MAANTLLRLVLLVILVGVTAGCMKELSPVSPDAPLDGILIYSEPDYAGQSAQLLRSVYDLYEYKGPCGIDYPGTNKSWSDCIQSIRVTPGWQTTLYADRQYGGKSLQLTADAPDLSKVAGPCNGSWTRCVGSIFVARQ
jgi:hypothetical protein